MTDRTIKNSAKTGRSMRDAKSKGRPFLSPNDVEAAARETRHFLDMDNVQVEFWQHWESTGKPEVRKGVAIAFTGFAKKKYGQLAYGKK